MEILLLALGFLGLGIPIGFGLKTWIYHRAKYSGTIYITRKSEKTLYSLELEDYPEKLVFQKEVVFKVDASDESLNRN